MHRLVLSAVVVLFVSGCTTPPIVYAPKDGPTDEPSGMVRPLRELIRTSPRLRVVFMHGVGDHCPGYALDPEDGWLNTNAMQVVGLTHVPSEDEDLHLVNVNLFADGGEPDPLSHVAYVKRQYRLALKDTAREVDVEAIEITWSPLTQWIKSNQLGYDAPSTTPPAAKRAKDCIPPADATHFAGKSAPPRLALDRLIKEQVFDRNLADAILYSGTYGWVMERGVAEALCRALSGWGSETPCPWPAGRADEDVRYVFVTHSLGSRMLYDTILDLLGRTTDAKRNPFDDTEQAQATSVVRGILARTTGLYMMANQISLLGLASVPHSARSSQGMAPYVAYLDFRPLNDVTPSPSTSAKAKAKSKSLAQMPFPLPRSTAIPKAPSISDERVAQPPIVTPTDKFGDVLTGILRARKLAQGATDQHASLEIVAFNDTNDLLTWHIPPWYAVAAESDPTQTSVNFVNVFVQNTPKLLVIEEPTAAHDNYFKRLSVWEVIVCGAEDGHVRKCP